MILDSLENADRYLALHPDFAEAFALLRNCEEWLNRPGKHALKEDSFYVIVETSEGKTHAGARLESHRRYLDIQYVVSGSEEMGWAPLEQCQNTTSTYNPEKDIAFYGDQPTLWFPLPPKHFAIFYPEDAHAPLGASGPVSKIIIKLAVD